MGYKKIRWTDAFVVCLLYRTEQETPRTIRCESYFDGATAVLTFKSSGAQDKVMGRYCCSMTGYERCPYYQAVDKKYE